MALDGALARLETTLDALRDKPAEIENLVRRIRQARFDLQFIVTGADKKFVYWTERRGRGFFLRASPIDVSGLLEDKLFGQVETVVLTSATLSSAGNFAFIRERLGLDKAGALIAESTLTPEQALLSPAKALSRSLIGPAAETSHQVVSAPWPDVLCFQQSRDCNRFYTL